MEIPKSKLDTAKEILSKLNDSTEETIQNIAQKDK